ncbi:MAG: class I SAM-dependent methyltransferase [Candidatus Krumholzibacteria bacterium]|nr:class I SAM-dependent methyltransferase [Candidatus Krumholzibacteria bacterium]
MDACEERPGSKQYGKVLLTLADLGHGIGAGAAVLDFGCGGGSGVEYMRRRGFDAYGCDLRFKESDAVPELEASGRVRRIETAPYRLPFEDDRFDLVFSCQVFEHVSDYREALGEIRRVLRPGGRSLHIFPSRGRLIESHVRVPLASVFRPRWYLLLWALLGIRTRNQKGISAREVARRNCEVLTERTNYLSRKAIASHVGEFFDEYAFCELAAARHSRLRPAWPVLRRIPFASRLLGAFQTRVLFFRKTPA